MLDSFDTTYKRDDGSYVYVNYQPFVSSINVGWLHDNRFDTIIYGPDGAQHNDFVEKTTLWGILAELYAHDPERMARYFDEPIRRYRSNIQKQIDDLQGVKDDIDAFLNHVERVKGNGV